MSDDDGLAAFGYKDDGIPVYNPDTFQVAEGKTKNTLRPAIIVYLKGWGADSEIGFGFDADDALRLAAEIVKYAELARSKHWEQPGDAEPPPDP